MGYTTPMMLFYTVAGAIAFLALGGAQVLASFPDIEEKTCPRRGPCTDTLEFSVGKIYLQVISGTSFMFASCLYFEGKTAILGAMGALIATMTKHITVDALIPPPPVMVMTGLVVLVTLFASELWAKRVFIGFCALNAATFLLNPLQVLTDSFPEITEGTKAFNIGAFCLEVVAWYMLVCAIVIGLPAQLGKCLAWTTGVPLIGKHVLINGSGPPGPMIVFFFMTLAVAWYENGWTNHKPAAEKAIGKAMKLHATIVATGFGPYFIAEGIGLSFPMVGFSAIDKSYDYTPATSLLCLMMALLLYIVAYHEYFLKMEGKVFIAYHYALSCIVLFWQMQPTTTLIGKLFFMPPHLFTLWGTFIVLSKSSPKLI